MRAVTTVVVLLSIAATPVFAGGSSTAHWVLQKSPTSVTLRDISCSSISECVAVGAKATMIRTVNGGQTWTTVKSGFGMANPSASFIAVRCPVSRVCSVVAAPNVVLHTTNGGTTWQTSTFSLPSGLSSLSRLACPARNVCFVTASPAGSVESWTRSAAIFKTSDGARAWHQVTTPALANCDGDCGTADHPYRWYYDLDWISCVTTQRCRSGGTEFIDSHSGYVTPMIGTNSGGQVWHNLYPCHPSSPCVVSFPRDAACPTITICTGVSYDLSGPVRGQSVARSINGGGTWSDRSINTLLTAIACSGKVFCGLAGRHGKVARAIGLSLTMEASPTTKDLNGIACPAAGVCYAVGASGTIVRQG